ncbi:HK97 family phage prohead protease [Paenibacillus oryzisoli]|uniref:HK97 family phage prohead protease n=1 Tax=Paenibacillus oryzisoli TaxID=1850517 RepID=UPI0014288CBF|nr:HK97 family phage prohead protease [Paenibacillus oryzisoli]
MKREMRHFDMEEVEIRAKEEGGESRTITGYAARFDKLSVNLGGFREKISRGAFARSLKTENIRALWNHNRDIVLGSTKAGTLRLWEDDKGLRFDFDAPASPWGDTALESIRRGDVEGMSFGFSVRNDTWEENGKELIRTLDDVDLFEVSPTAFPAYPSSSASARSTEDVLSEYRSSHSGTNEDENKQKEAELNMRARLLLT